MSRILQGNIVNKETLKRYSNATVLLEKGGTILLTTVTDECGNFKFDIEDETKFPSGDYNLVAFHSDAVQAESPLRVVFESGKSPVTQKIEMLEKQQTSALAGIIFATALSIVTVLVLFLYFDWRKDNKDKLHYQLPALIQTTVVKIPSDTIQQKREEVLKDSIILTNFLVTIDSVVSHSIQQEKEVDSLYNATLQILLRQAKNAVESKQYQYLTVLLNSIGKYEDDRVFPFFWGSKHTLMIGVFFGALVATLLRLIAQASYYVRMGSFQVNGITHKAALIVTIPLLAVIVTLILSYLKFSFSIGDSSLKVDLSDQIVSIIIAVLIGLAPWGTWEFMNSLSDSLFAKLRGFTSSKGNSTESSQA